MAISTTSGLLDAAMQAHGGIVVPTRRRVYGYQGDHEVVPDPVLVAIDINEIAFSS